MPTLPMEAGERALALRGLFDSDWARAPAGFRLREESELDLSLLRTLYASTRADELARSGWSEAQQQAFVDQQFTAQRQQYRQHYPGAAFLVVERDGIGIGRIYLHWGRDELRLMEITLLPDCRRQGIARVLLTQLIEWTQARALAITLHVEPFNPAHAWYVRLGFITVEQRGIYHFMRREPVGAAPHS